MGARAAVVAATAETEHLVLVSYPLQTAKEVRDQILLDLPAAVKVLFVSGDGDSMCELGALREVRAKMKCRSWLVTVRGADHGMNVKPKAATEAVGLMTGEVAARWVLGEKGKENSVGMGREGSIFWSREDEVAVWSGWDEKEEAPVKTSKSIKASGKVKKPKVAEKLEVTVADNASGLGDDTGSVATRTRKRQKRS
jgi:hypothetical protein